MTIKPMPKLPKKLTSDNWTEGQRQQRRRERAAILQETYGVRFSLAGSNPLAVKMAKAKGYKYAGLPKACFDSRNFPPLTDVESPEQIITEIKAAFYRITHATGDQYVTLTALAFESELDFETLFRGLARMRKDNPYTISFSVDRLGNATYVRIL